MHELYQSHKCPHTHRHTQAHTNTNTNKSTQNLHTKSFAASKTVFKRNQSLVHSLSYADKLPHTQTQQCVIHTHTETHTRPSHFDGLLLLSLHFQTCPVHFTHTSHAVRQSFNRSVYQSVFLLLVCQLVNIFLLLHFQFRTINTRSQLALLYICTYEYPVGNFALW